VDFYGLTTENIDGNGDLGAFGTGLCVPAVLQGKPRHGMEVGTPPFVSFFFTVLHLVGIWDLF